MNAVPILTISGFIAVVILTIKGGRRLGLRRRDRLPDTALSVISTMQAATFGLMGLLIAFIFYGAGSRFDVRRNLKVQEANAISTAYLRLDLLPSHAQPSIREDFRDYLRARLAVYRAIPNLNAVKAALEQSSAIQRSIWRKAIAAVKEVGPAEKSLVTASLNEMIDITAVRTLALTTHPPSAVFAMLALSVVVASGLAGYSMAAHGVYDWPSVYAFALILGTAVYVILDYEYPRLGIIRIDPVDQVLVDVLKTMK